MKIIEKYPIIDGQKILFLDIDGVLNSEESFKLNHQMRLTERENRGEGAEFAKEFCFPLGHLCELLIDNLNIIIECTDCWIVISSSWRIGHDYKEIANFLTQKGFKYPYKIIGETESNSVDARGGEIQDWLDIHPTVTNYVILDDDAEDIVGNYTTKKHPNNFVHIPFKYGLQSEHIKAAVNILNK